MCCPCGREKILALGLCSTCYTLKGQDEECFGGYREEVLTRDGYRCRIPGCRKAGTAKRTLAVHHREPGNNDPDLMITLCLAHHAMVTRTQMLCKDCWPVLLRILWREQHPEAHETNSFRFHSKKPGHQASPSFSRMTGGVLPDRAALAADWVANLAMSSRRWSFCFLSLLNLALSPFCDDICPRSSDLFVTQSAEDKSVRSSIRQATDGRCEAQGTLSRNPLQRLRVRLFRLLPGCRQNVLRHARSILYLSKDLPCRCRLGNLAQRSGRHEADEVTEKWDETGRAEKSTLRDWRGTVIDVAFIALQLAHSSDLTSRRSTLTGLTSLFAPEPSQRVRRRQTEEVPHS